MKKFLSLMTAAILMAGCVSSSQNLLFSPGKIKKAETAAVEKNDLDAVILLSKTDHKSFFASQNGIVVLNTNFKRITPKMDGDSLYWLARAYGQYPDMLVNGEQREKKLLEWAYSKKNQDAAIQLLARAIQYEDKDHWQTLQNQAMPLLDTRHLSTLYIKYADLYKNGGTQAVIEEMKKRKAPLPDRYYISKIKENESLYYNNGETAAQTINQLLAGNDIKKIQRILHALLADNGRADGIVRLCRYVLDSDPENPDALYGMGRLYEQGNAGAGIQKDQKKAMDLYTHAMDKGQMDAAFRLLTCYGETKEFNTAYLKLKNRLLQSEAGKLVLARYFSSQNRIFAQEMLLTPLAEKGNQKAILALALADDSHADSFEVKEQVAHWREYIFEYGSETLKQQFLTGIEKIDRYYGNNYGPKSEILSLRTAYRRSRMQGQNQKMLDLLEQAAALQDKQSILKLARICLSGKSGLPSDPGKGLGLLGGLAEQGDVDAMDELGQYFSINGYQNFPLVLPMVRRAADNGQEDALYILVDYLTGLDHRPENFTEPEIKHYISKACPEPESEALVLGRAYEKGGVLQKNIDLARANYLQAAKGRVPEGYYRLGMLELKTADTQVLRKEALGYLEKAVKSGDETAAMELGRIYQKGKILPKDTTQAMEYYRIASDSYAEAFRRMGLIFQERKQYKKALETFAKGADAGDAISMWLAGKALETGQGIDKHPEYAAKAYQMAMDKGYAAAAYDLAMLYINGAPGVEKDREKGIALLKKAGTKAAKTALAGLEGNK